MDEEAHIQQLPYSGTTGPPRISRGWSCELVLSTFQAVSKSTGYRPRIVLYVAGTSNGLIQNGGSGWHIQTGIKLRFQSSDVASVLQLNSRGEFLRVFRPPSHPSSCADPFGPRNDRRRPLISLGKTIVFMYLAALMAAMISARVLPQADLDRPEAPAIETFTLPADQI